MVKMIIIGAGRKAEHLCDLFKLWDNLYQFYDTPRVSFETKRNIPVADSILTDKKFIVYSAVGKTRDKRIIIKQFKEEAQTKNMSYKWGTMKHDTSIITYSNIGKDFILREFSSIGSQCRIGDHVSIGPLANVSHNTVIGDYSTICGQAAISGGVYIGEGVFIGQGASVKPDVRIGRGAVIGTGAVVVKDVPRNWVVGGNPARNSPKFKRVSDW